MASDPAPDAAAPLAVPDPEFLWTAHEHVYRADHRGDWLLLALFAAIPVITGASIWRELGAGSRLGREICGALALIALFVARAIFVARIDAGVVLSREGVAAYCGSRRRELPWGEVARLLERTRGEGLRRRRSVVAEGYGGRRLCVTEGALADYARFRRDVYAAHRDWREHGDALDASWDGPEPVPYAAEERGRGARWLRDGALGLGLLGVYLWGLVPGAGTAGAAAFVAAALCAGLVVAAWTGQQTFVLDGRGIEGRCRRRRRRLEWGAITRVKWEPAFAFLGPGLAHAATRGLRALSARPDRWTDGTRWPVQYPDDLVLRAAGLRLRLHPRRVTRPDPLVARIQASLRRAQMVEAAELAALLAARRSSAAPPALPAPDTGAVGAAAEGAGDGAPGAAAADAPSSADAGAAQSHQVV